jgi:hypothetical protein
MNDAHTVGHGAEDIVAHEATVDHYIAEMVRLQGQMANDRDEILVLQAETRAILEDVMLMLNAA